MNCNAFISPLVEVGVFCLGLDKGFVLTAYSFIWHYILICMGAIAQCHSFKKATKVFFFFVGFATFLNVLIHPIGYIDMFYINPFRITTQPIFREIGIQYGVFIQNITYITSIICASLGIYFVRTRR